MGLRSIYCYNSWRRPGTEPTNRCFSRQLPNFLRNAVQDRLEAGLNQFPGLPSVLYSRLNGYLWLLLLAIGINVAEVQAAEEIVFGHILKTTTAHHENLVWAASEIEKRLAGRYRLRIYPEGQIGTSDVQVIEGFETGTADMAYLSFGHLQNTYPSISIGAGPFVFRDFDHWQAFSRSNLLKTLKQGMERELGLKTFENLAYYGARHITTREPLNGLADIKGLVVRTPPIRIIVSMFRAVQANPVQIPFLEVYQALEARVVDAQENPLPAIKAMRFHEVTPVINRTAHILDAQLIVMNTSRWKALPPQDQRVFAAILLRRPCGSHGTCDAGNWSLWRNLRTKVLASIRLTAIL